MLFVFVFSSGQTRIRMLAPAVQYPETLPHFFDFVLDKILLLFNWINFILFFLCYLEESWPA
jgi:hypothetical protein